MNLNKKTFVNDLVPGQKVEEIFVLAEARQQQARNGPYWLLRLQDSQGMVEAKIWSPVSQRYAEFLPGTLIRIQGQVVSFRDQIQITVEQADVLDLAEQDVDWSLFLPRSSRDPALLLKDVEELCTRHLRHEPWRTFCLTTLRDETVRARLLTAPGAKTLHHAYIGGLLEHTLAVCRLCMTISAHYPQLDRETMLAGAVFHDLGKAWELTAGVQREYTNEGRLLGHIQLGLEVLGPFLENAPGLTPELKLHFKHLLISHHGEYEFGSPKRPKTLEALVLHYADNLDAKMNMVEQLLENTPGQESWTPYQRSMERQFYRAVHTPSLGTTPDNESELGSESKTHHELTVQSRPEQTVPLETDAMPEKQVENRRVASTKKSQRSGVANFLEGLQPYE